MEEIEVHQTISETRLRNAHDMVEFKNKYKWYLKIKRILPLSLIAPLTGGEISRMALASALGSKSVSLTLPGLIGYSLPAYYFFHMSSFYVPDKLKPICQVCKFTLGAPVWIVCSLTDALTADSEQVLFGEEVPLDIVNTGGTIPSELGDFNKIKDVLKDMEEFGRKTY